MKSKIEYQVAERVALTEAVLQRDPDIAPLSIRREARALAAL